MDDKAEFVHDNPLVSPTLHSPEKCWDVHTEINESNKNTPKILESRPEKGSYSMEGLMKFNSGVHAETAESNKNTPNVWEGSPEKSASSIEGLIYPDYCSPTQEQTRDTNSDYARHGRLQSTMEDDKEWESPAELIMRAGTGTLIVEQEDDHGIYDKEEREVMPCSASPPIIQGVAPFGSRSRSLRYRPSPASEISAPKRRVGKSIAGIQTTEEQSKAEESYHGSSTCQGGARSEGTEVNVSESHYPQLAQEPLNSEEQRSKISIEDAQQPDGTMQQPKSNSLIDDSISRSTVGFRRHRPLLCKMMLPLFVFLALATAYFGFGLPDTNYSSAKNVEDHKPHMNPLPLRERFSPQKIERYSSWLFQVAVHSEYMGRLKNSSGAVVGKFVDSVCPCTCSAFSYLTSPTRYMTKEVCGKFVDFSRRFIGNLLNFPYQDLLVWARSVAHEIQGLCKCFNSNKTVESMIASCPMESGINYSAPMEDNQVSEQGTNQGIQENSSTEQIDFIQEPDNSTIDAENYGCQEVDDQMVAADQEDSSFSEENESEKQSSSP